MCLLHLVKGPLDDLVGCQFAFRKHHQAHEVVWCFRSLVEKANEWQLHLKKWRLGDVSAIERPLLLHWEDTAADPTILPYRRVKRAFNSFMRDLGLCAQEYFEVERILDKRPLKASEAAKAKAKNGDAATFEYKVKW